MFIHYIHRGLAKKNFKENTLPAFKYSFKQRYGIETDIQVTKDNQLICFHDFNLKRIFNLNKSIKDINYLTLKAISKKKKATIPLLEELLKISKNKYPLLLEIKPLFKDSSLGWIIENQLIKFNTIDEKNKKIWNYLFQRKKLNQITQNK